MPVVGISELSIRHELQPRGELSPGTVREYADAMIAGDVFPPVTTFGSDEAKYLLADGFHRVAAAELAGIRSISVEVKPGGFRDAQLYSFGVNACHGLRRTQEDVRRAIERLLLDDEWVTWSDNWLGEIVGCSNHTVESARGQLEGTWQIAKLTQLLGKDGKWRPRKQREPEPDFFQEIPRPPTRKSVTEVMDEEEILTAARTIRAERTAVKRADQINKLAEIEATNATALPEDKRYACLVIDPPWPMAKIERDLYPDQVEFEYPTLTEDQLAELPVSDVAHDDAHLYLWTTQKFLPMALRLSDAWGFKYQCLLTWVKNVGFTPYSWMYSTEHVLFCRRGSLELLRNGIRLDFNAKRREHSRKPEEFYDIVREASPGPRIDMFSREARVGFDQWGKETGKF